MFGPIVFPAFAAIHLLLAIASLAALSAVPLAAMGLAIVELITTYDNVVVALGNRLGIGPLLYELNRARFFLHAVLIGLLVPVYAGIGHALGIPAFGTQTFQGLIIVVTAGLCVFGYRVGYKRLRLITPVDYYGCLRYAQSVTPASRRDDYEYSAEELNNKGFPPFASILTVLIGLALSIWIGVATGFWVPAIVTGLMMLAGSLPPNAFGALATATLEIIFSTGLVYSLLRAAGY